jgi:uracil-DNA glycosylase
MAGRTTGSSREQPELFDSGASVAYATLDDCRRAAAACRACHLYEHATQTVFGEGDPHADIALIGEQPGNDEDLAGRPFVGPAGRLLDRALAEAGLDRQRLYVTNAVKHFKWKAGGEGGKRRIHETPSQSEVEACRPWFQQELALVRPAVLLGLGATAAAASLGRRVTIGSSRGRALESRFGIPAYVTIHPSGILRIPERQGRDAEFERFVADLRTVSSAAATLRASSR